MSGFQPPDSVRFTFDEQAIKKMLEGIFDR